MSDNGKAKKTLIEVSLYNGTINIDFATDVNMALISHGLRLANLELDNAIIANQTPSEENIVKPSNGIIDFVRKGKKL